jgi:predicted nucleotidyltransferase
MYSQPSPKPEDLIPFLVGRPEILFAVLYGSATEGGIFRDLDVGVMVDRSCVPAGVDLDYALDLAGFIEKTVRFPIDVRVINDAPLPFLFNVSRGIPLVVHDWEAWYRFRERAWDDYLDFKPVAMQYLRELV